MTSLPPLRDLPPQRHAEIRTELVRVANASRHGTARRWLVPLAVAAAATAIVAVVGIVVAGPRAPEDLLVAAPALAEIPGLTAHERSEIERVCMSTIAKKQRTILGEMRLYNRVIDEAGTYALLYSDRGVRTCWIAGDKLQTGVLSEIPSIAWMRDVLVVDERGAAHFQGGGIPGMQEIGGRITADVAKVVITTGDGKTVQAQIANGTFLARIVRPPAWKNTSVPVTVTAYGVDGKILARDPETGPKADCYATPDGTVLFEPKRDPQGCAPAVRWPTAGAR